jgi:uncharacterized membrane protein
MPFAALSAAASRGDFAKDGTGVLGLFRGRAARLGTGLAAVGEAIADKTPYVPSRIEPAPLAGRIAAGGFAGALFAKGNGRPLVPGALIGALASAGGSFAGYAYRTKIGPKIGLPDPLVAIVEDIAAFTIATRAVRKPD